MREIVYGIYKGQCAATGEHISINEADVGHIVPQSESDFFESLYPGLDVHNLINLHLLRKGINRRNSNGIVLSPLAIHNAISYSAKLIDRRLDKTTKLKRDDDFLWLDNLFSPEILNSSDKYRILQLHLENLREINKILRENNSRLIYMQGVDRSFPLSWIHPDLENKINYKKFDAIDVRKGKLSSGDLTKQFDMAILSGFTGTVIVRRSLTMLKSVHIREINLLIDKLGIKRVNEVRDSAIDSYSNSPLPSSPTLA
jgi:hypothetical protein